MSEMRADRRCWLPGLVACLLTGACRAGFGEGWVVGSVHVQQCRGSGTLERAGDYDLGADFFVADPLHDASESTQVRRNSLTMRIQHTSNRAEESDGLALHLHDAAAAARAFARGELVAVGDCLELAGCPSGDLVLRSQLNLYNTCPANRSALTASNREVGVTDPARPECFRPVPMSPAAAPHCPVLGDSERDELIQICDGDLDDRSHGAAIERILGRDNVYDESRALGNACVFFCALGAAKRGQPEAELADFEVDFGDRVAAIFSFNMVDARAFQIGQCAAARAQLHGLFSFEVVRSRTAQAFP